MSPDDLLADLRSGDLDGWKKRSLIALLDEVLVDFAKEKRRAEYFEALAEIRREDISERTDDLVAAQLDAEHLRDECLRHHEFLRAEGECDGAEQETVRITKRRVVLS